MDLFSNIPQIQKERYDISRHNKKIYFKIPSHPNPKNKLALKIPRYTFPNIIPLSHTVINNVFGSDFKISR
jgi:hypothetical protein